MWLWCLQGCFRKLSPLLHFSFVESHEVDISESKETNKQRTPVPWSLFFPVPWQSQMPSTIGFRLSPTCTSVYAQFAIVGQMKRTRENTTRKPYPNVTMTDFIPGVPACLSIFSTWQNWMASVPSHGAGLSIPAFPNPCCLIPSWWLWGLDSLCSHLNAQALIYIMTRIPYQG